MKKDKKKFFLIILLIILTIFIFLLRHFYFSTDSLPIADFVVSDIPEINDFINDKPTSSDAAFVKSHKVSNLLFNNTNKTIDNVVFSKDGNHVAYILREPGGPNLVIKDGEVLSESYNNKNTGVFGNVSNYRLDWALRMSNGGNYLFYIWNDDCRETGDMEVTCNNFIVINEKKIGPFDKIGPVIFSEDNENMAFVANKLGKKCVFFNSKSYGCHTFVLNLTLSSDGKTLAYITGSKSEGSKIRLISHGKEQEFDLEYKDVFDIALGAQKDKIAYYISHQNYDWQNYDSQEKEATNKACVVLDDKEKCHYDIGATEMYGQFLNFSPSGDLVYIVPEYVQGKGKNPDRNYRMFINNDDEYALPFETVNHLRFNPSKKEILFGAIKNGNFGSPLLMGRLDYETDSITEGPTYKKINFQEVSFSPDGEHFVYTGTKSSIYDKWHLVIDNTEDNKEYGIINNLNFNSDGNKLSFGTLSGQEWWWIVQPLE